MKKLIFLVLIFLISCQSEVQIESIRTVHSTDNGENHVYKITVDTYDRKERLIQSEEYSPKEELRSVTTYEYKNDLLVKTSRDENGLESYSLKAYDNKDRLISTRSYSKDKLKGYTEYSYTGEHDSSHKMYDENGQLLMESTTEYSDEYNLISTTNDYRHDVSMTIEVVLNEDELPIEMTMYDQGDTNHSTIEYNEHGHETKKYTNGQLSSEYQYEYDEHMNKVKQVLIINDSKFIRTMTIKYRD